MNDYQKLVAECLLKRGAVSVSLDPLFTWTSGIKSPIYCDNRKMISFVEERKLIIEGFKNLIESKNIEFDVIGGTATAAIPWAAFLAQELNVPMIYIRPEKKAHGAGKQIEGVLEEGQRVLIVEDLISTGGSSVKAVKAVREEGGCEVNDVMAIVTYGFEASVSVFEEANVKMHTLTNFEALVACASEMEGFFDGDIEEVLNFSKDPINWFKK